MFDGSFATGYEVSAHAIFCRLFIVLFLVLPQLLKHRAFAQEVTPISEDNTSYPTDCSPPAKGYAQPYTFQSPLVFAGDEGNIQREETKFASVFMTLRGFAILLSIEEGLFD